MPSRIIQARLVQVLATPDTGHFRTQPVPRLDVDLRGIPGDRHYGFTRRAGARERWYEDGMEMRSGRQITLVSVEDLAEIARRMDIPHIDPAWIGANALVEGLKDFSLLPWGARLFCGDSLAGDGAVLVNEGDNAPCRFAGAEIARHFPDRAGLDLAFPKKAVYLRGILASVERAGAIVPGPIKIKIPIQPAWPGATGDTLL